MMIGNGYLSTMVFLLSGPKFTQRRSIPSPSPSFFPTTTTLVVYGLLDFSITPFLSISLIWFSIHLFSFGDLCLSLQVAKNSPQSIFFLIIFFFFAELV